MTSAKDQALMFEFIGDCGSEIWAGRAKPCSVRSGRHLRPRFAVFAGGSQMFAGGSQMFTRFLRPCRDAHSSSCQF
jgi:hypothetical protein